MKIDWLRVVWSRIISVLSLICSCWAETEMRSRFACAFMKNIQRNDVGFVNTNWKSISLKHTHMVLVILGYMLVTSTEYIMLALIKRFQLYKLQIHNFQIYPLYRKTASLKFVIFMTKIIQGKISNYPFNSNENINFVLFNSNFELNWMCMNESFNLTIAYKPIPQAHHEFTIQWTAES